MKKIIFIILSIAFSATALTQKENNDSIRTDYIFSKLVKIKSDSISIELVKEKIEKVEGEVFKKQQIDLKSTQLQICIIFYS